MANITVKDLSAYSDSENVIQDLSEKELDLSGGNPLLVAYIVYEVASTGYALYRAYERSQD
jgi:hypothetical protein